MARRDLKALVVLVGLVVSVMFAGGCTGLFGVAAEVRNPKRQVEARYSIDADFHIASEGSRLAVGGAVRTGEDSTALILFGTRAQAMIEPESAFEVGTGNVLGKQTGGTMMYLTATDQASLAVETPQGTLSAPGAEFLLEVTDTGSIVLVDAGTAVFTNLVGNSRSVHGHERLVVPVKGPLPVPEKMDQAEVDKIFRPIKQIAAPFNQR